MSKCCSSLVNLIRQSRDTLQFYSDKKFGERLFWILDIGLELIEQLWQQGGPPLYKKQAIKVNNDEETVNIESESKEEGGKKEIKKNNRDRFIQRNLLLALNEVLTLPSDYNCISEKQTKGRSYLVLKSKLIVIFH